MPPLDFADISGWTAFGVLAMAVIGGVMSGMLVPRRTHKDTIRERDLWREVATTKLDGTITELTDQLRETRIVGRTVTAALERGADEATR